MHTVSHYPAVYFRLLPILNNPSYGDFSPQVSGFRFAIDQNMEDEVYIEPLGEDAFWADYLHKAGITQVFTHNEVGIKKL